MNDRRSIFYDEWRACLYAHYQHVILVGDTITEPTLRRVLLQAGLREDELASLQPVDPGAYIEPAADTGYVEDDMVEDVVESGDDYVDFDESGEPDDFDDEPPPAQLSLF